MMEEKTFECKVHYTGNKFGKIKVENKCSKNHKISTDKYVLKHALQWPTLTV
jgi:hypothetical protein